MGDKTLEEKTRSYWDVSRAYNLPRGCANMTTEEAIKHLGDIEDKTSSRKTIAKKATKLLDDIIGYSPVENKVEDTFPNDFAA